MGDEITETYNQNALLQAVISGGIISGAVGVLEGNFGSSKYILPTAAAIGIYMNYKISQAQNTQEIELVKTHWDDVKQSFSTLENFPGWGNWTGNLTGFMKKHNYSSFADFVQKTPKITQEQAENIGHVNYWKYLAQSLAGVITIGLGYKALLKIGQYQPGNLIWDRAYPQSDVTSFSSSLGISDIPQTPDIMRPGAIAPGVSRILAPTILQLIASAARGDVMKRAGMQVAVGVVSQVLQHSGLADKVIGMVKDGLSGQNLVETVSKIVDDVADKLSSSLSIMAEHVGITNEKIVILQDPHGGGSFALLLNTESGNQEAIPTFRLRPEDWQDVVKNAKRSLNITPAVPPIPGSRSDTGSASVGGPSSVLDFSDPPDFTQGPPPVALFSTPTKHKGTRSRVIIPDADDDAFWGLTMPYYPTAHTREEAALMMLKDLDILANTLATIGSVHSGGDWGTLMAMGYIFDDTAEDIVYSFKDTAKTLPKDDATRLADTDRRPVYAPGRDYHFRGGGTGSMYSGMPVRFHHSYNPPPDLIGFYFLLVFDPERGVAVIGSATSADRLLVPLYALVPAGGSPGKRTPFQTPKKGGGGSGGKDDSDEKKDGGGGKPPQQKQPPSDSSSYKSNTSGSAQGTLVIDQLSTTNYLKASKSFDKNPRNLADLVTEITDYLFENRVLSIRGGKPFTVTGYHLNKATLLGYLNYDYSKIVRITGMTIDAIRSKKFTVLQKSIQVITKDDNLNVYYKRPRNVPILYEPVKLPGFPKNEWFVFYGVSTENSDFGAFGQMNNLGEVTKNYVNYFHLGAVKLILRNYGTENWQIFRKLIYAVPHN